MAFRKIPLISPEEIYLDKKEFPFIFHKLWNLQKQYVDLDLFNNISNGYRLRANCS